VDIHAPVPNKVHIRGVDSLNTFHIKQFAAKHYPLELFHKIEWINDTSVNIAYDTERAAEEALVAFSVEEGYEPLTLRQAKPLSAHPDVVLEVRQTVESDVKDPNAREKSKFYLNNPQWDPDNRNRKRRRPERGGYHSNKYPRREWADEQNHRRTSNVSFTEDMYDEQPTAAEQVQRRGSSYSDGEYGRRPINYGDGEDFIPRAPSARSRDRSPPRDNRYGRRPADYGERYGERGDLMAGPIHGNFRERSASPDNQYSRRPVEYRERQDLIPRTTNGRLRDRTASPRINSDGDGRYGFAEQYPRRRTPPPRSRTPPRIPDPRDNRDVRSDLRKELFPRRPSSSGLDPSGYSNGSPFRTPGRPFSSSSNRELFPDKLNSSTHRRKDAKDIHPDEVADAIGKYTISNPPAEQYTYAKPGLRPEYEDRRPHDRAERGAGGGGSRDLFARVDRGSTAVIGADYGRLSEAYVSGDGDVGFSIRGASNKGRGSQSSAKELFPATKAVNGGKDLFDMQIKGRGGQRWRAEEL